MPALIFDCDGVLADTEKDGHRVAFNRVFTEVGAPLQWSVADYGPLLAVGGGKERIRASLTPDLLRQAGLPDDFKALTELVAQWHQRKSEVYQELVMSGALPPRPGVARLADEALGAGWSIAVASTSAHDSVEAVVRQVFSPKTAAQISIFAGDVVSRKKPAPDIYQVAAAALEHEPAACTAIEDSPIGCASAVAANMTCVVTESEYTVGDDFASASLVVDNLGEPGGPHTRVLDDPYGIGNLDFISLSTLQQIAHRARAAQIEGKS